MAQSEDPTLNKFSSNVADSNDTDSEPSTSAGEEILSDSDVNLQTPCKDCTDSSPPLSSEEIESPSPRKSVEECLSTIEKLERTCSELHNKCKQQQCNLDMVVKQLSVAVKEKEAMVMRYAVGEKTVLDLKSAKENAEKKQKEACRENEILQRKASVMASEKTRICQMLDNKKYDLKCNQQELDKVKLDLTALETKLKWSQNSLTTEKDLRKESDSKLESLRLKVQEQVSEIEQTKREAQDSMKAFYHSQENRACVLEQQFKEQQATLILLRHEKDDRDKDIKSLQTELQFLQSKEKDTSEDNVTMLTKLQTLEKEHMEMSSRFNDVQQTNVDVKQLTLQLQNERQQNSKLLEQLEFLKQLNTDLETDLKPCRERESDLLTYTEQLTSRNVQLLSEFTAMEMKVHQLKCEHKMFKRTAVEYEEKVDLLTRQLVNDRCNSSDLAKRLEEKTKLCESLSVDVSDQQGENGIIKRKYELSLKEINKELQQCRKKIDQYETTSQSSNSSSSSDPDGDQVKVIQPELSLDKKALVEHIVKLQRISARKSEKIDFLEEHINTLVAELQRKTHLLQSYIIREQTGTLSSNKMDKNKANIAKLNGIMASVYGSRVADNNLTLELSLDINRKLQAVLEDALLKNITLKENIDTLGAEIDRLNKLLSPSYSNTVIT